MQSMVTLAIWLHGQRIGGSFQALGDWYGFGCTALGASLSISVVCRAVYMSTLRSSPGDQLGKKYEV